MASFFKSMFYGSGDSMKRSPSLNDFSMGASDHANEYQEEKGLAGAKKSFSEAVKDVAGGEEEQAASPKGNVWASTFNPGRNMSESYKKTVHNNYFDKLPGHDKTGEPTVWDMVLKGERLRIFQSFDRDNDGFVDAGDLMWRLGNSEEVKALIHAADKNGDGKLDYDEFVQLLKNS